MFTGPSTEGRRDLPFPDHAAPELVLALFLLTLVMLLNRTRVAADPGTFASSEVHIFSLLDRAKCRWWL